MYQYAVDYARGKAVKVSLLDSSTYKEELFKGKITQEDETYVEAFGRNIRAKKFQGEILYKLFDWETPIEYWDNYPIIKVNPEGKNATQPFLYVLSSKTSKFLTQEESAKIFPFGVDRILEGIIAVDKEYASNPVIRYEAVLYLSHHKDQLYRRLQGH